MTFLLSVFLVKNCDKNTRAYDFFEPHVPLTVAELLLHRSCGICLLEKWLKQWGSPSKPSRAKQHLEALQLQIRPFQIPWRFVLCLP